MVKVVDERVTFGLSVERTYRTARMSSNRPVQYWCLRVYGMQQTSGILMHLTLSFSGVHCIVRRTRAWAKEKSKISTAAMNSTMCLPVRYSTVASGSQMVFDKPLGYFKVPYDSAVIMV